VTTMTNFL